jgi:hypothetical protein
LLDSTLWSFFQSSQTLHSVFNSFLSLYSLYSVSLSALSTYLSPSFLSPSLFTLPSVSPLSISDSFLPLFCSSLFQLFNFLLFLSILSFSSSLSLLSFCRSAPFRLNHSINNILSSCLLSVCSFVCRLFLFSCLSYQTMLHFL